MINNKKYDIYLASPFFRPDQVEREERLKHLLRGLGFNVFSPKENSFLSTDADSNSRESTFLDNIMAIKESKAVFAITDGKDMGTIWESGFAFGIGVPIIYYAETLGNNPFNLMLSQSGRKIFTSDDKITKEQIGAVIEGKTKRFTTFEGLVE